MLVTLLNTKSHIPPLEAGIIPRKRLLQQLDNGLKHRLILISAPAGSGKTTLVSDWLQAQPHLARAWISLDASDSEPIRFLAYLAQTLETVLPRIRGLLRALWDMPNSPALNDFMVMLLNEIQAFQRPLIIVLDDYHVIENEIIHHLMSETLHHQSQNLHWCIISRHEPPLPLAKLRVRQHITELRADDLAFTNAEARLFFDQRLHMPLAENAIETLQKRTEGWIAALQLAGLALQETHQATDWLTNFSGSHAYIADYLTDEVLHHQSPAVREFLLQTAVLERFNAALCDAVTGKKNSVTLLEYLRRANLFLVPLDDQHEWFRYHHLFAELLLSRLRRDLPDFAPVGHRRASDWFFQQGYPLEAIQQALKIPDYVRASEIVESPERNIFIRGEANAVREILRAIPLDVQWQRPRLNLLHAWAKTTSGQLVEAQQHLQRVLELIADAPEDAALWGEIHGLRGLHHLLQQNIPQAIIAAQKALTLLPPSAAVYRCIVLMNLGLASLFSGDLEAARRYMLDAVAVGEHTQEPTLVIMPLCNLGQIDRTAGFLQQSEAHYQKAFLKITEWKQPRHPLLSMVYANLSQVYFEQNQLAKAREMAEKCLAWGEWIVPPNYLLPAQMVLALVYLLEGEKETAKNCFDKTILLHREYPNLPGTDYAVWQLRFYMLAGDTAGLRVWQRQWQLSTAILPETMLQHMPDYLALAWLWITQKEFSKALSLLDKLLPILEKLGHQQAQIECLILQALAYADASLAYAALEKALVFAKTGGYIRLFVDKGEILAKLLRDNAWDSALRPYIAHLLSQFSSEKVPESLTERELELLRMVSIGLSNQTIADELFLSLSTVKWHLNNLYSKLGVRSRTQALVRAKELHLL